MEELSKDLADDLERHGDYNRVEGKIRVCLEEGNDEFVTHTFLHELVHALLEASSKPRLSKNEAFVDSLAAVLHQYMKTKKGKLA